MQPRRAAKVDLVPFSADGVRSAVLDSMSESGPAVGLRSEKQGVADERLIDCVSASLAWRCCRASLTPFVLRGKVLAKQPKAGASCGRSDAKHDGPGNCGRTRGNQLDEQYLVQSDSYRMQTR